MKSLNMLITAVAVLAACDANPTEPASADLDLAAMTTASGACDEEIDREVRDSRISTPNLWGSGPPASMSFDVGIVWKRTGGRGPTESGR
jgi:hypothetical protein